VEDGAFEENGYRYHYDRDEILRRIAPLQTPWHPEKGDPYFSSVTTFIGLTWDLAQRHVYLPDQKHMKFLRRAQTFIASFNRQKCTLHDIDKIHGSLCYLTVIYLYVELYPSRSLITDLCWWEDVLSKEDFYRQLTPRGPASNLCIYTDASTSWGIGVIIDGRWKAFRVVQQEDRGSSLSGFMVRGSRCAEP